MIRNTSETHNGNGQRPAGFDDVWDYDGSTEARNRIVEENLGLCYYVAVRLRHRAPPGLDVDDLVAAGVFGLMRAVERFDPSRGVKFSTYAVKAISSHIRREILRWRELPAKPTGEPEEWPSRIAVDPADFDMHRHGREPDPADQVEAADLHHHAMRRMSPRERTIAQLRYADGMTLRATGDELGVTRERVRQIEHKMFRWLRTGIEAKAVIHPPGCTARTTSRMPVSSRVPAGGHSGP